jgi:hypothetical protein
MAPIVVNAQPAAPPASTSARPANTERLPEGAARPAARIADFAWLVGRWQGEGLGGAMDEVWSDSEGGAMVGYFRLVRGRNISFITGSVDDIAVPLKTGPGIQSARDTPTTACRKPP